MSEPLPGDEEAFERLADAHDAFYVRGELELALELLADVDETLAERWALEARIASDVGDADLAEIALARARALDPDEESLDVLEAAGLLALAAWRLDEAEEALQRVADEDPQPWVLDRLSLLADLRGDFARADRLLEEAHRLDPEGSPRPPRLTPEAFEAVVDQACRDLPPEFSAYLDEVPIVIDPVPTPPSPLPPDVLGLFHGRGLDERDSGVSGELPAVIYLYQRNLERSVRDEDELREEIRVTLYHELGHMLGFDEDGVEGMGLG